MFAVISNKLGKYSKKYAFFILQVINIKSPIFVNYIF